MSDGKGHWVSLEMLVVEYAQAINHTNRLLPATTSYARHALLLEHERRLKYMAQKFVNGINVRDWHEVSSALCSADGTDYLQDKAKREELFLFDDNTKFVRNSRDVARTSPLETLKSFAGFAADDLGRTSKAHIAMIDELAGQQDPSNTTLLQVLQEELKIPRDGEPPYEFTDPATATIQTVADFTGKDGVLSRRLMEGTKKDKNHHLLLDLVQPSSLLLKPLREHADLKAKALLVDVQRESVQKDYEGQSEAHFPPNLRAKFNFMLGGPNFHTKVLSLTSGNGVSRMMVVGAHIKRPVCKIDTNCPSVATVVANIDDKALHFPGSARVQLTFESHTVSDKNGKQVVTGKIAPAI